MNDLNDSYRISYLMRLWRSDGQWRASLEIPRTGKRIGFANLEQLFAYLMDLIEGKVKMQNGNDKGKERTDKAD